VTHTAAGWLNTFDPFALHLTQSFGIRWYGLAYLAGFLATYWFAARLSKRGASPLTPLLVSDFIFYAALGTVVGGRLGYCFLYDQSLLFRFTNDFPFWGVLMIHHGGMASHGGMIGVVVACLLFARAHKVSPLHLMDLTVTGGCIGIFFGRIANFINGELVGRPCDPSLSWAVRFPQDILSWPSEAPERVATLGPVVTHLGESQERWEMLASSRPFSGAVYRSLEQIVAELQKGNQAVAEALAPLLTPRHPSQLYQCLLEGLFLGLVAAWLWRKNLKSGVIAGVFLTLYPLVRIVGEQFRMPDAIIGFDALGLTRGQWLSFGMFIVGASCLYRWTRSVSRKNMNPHFGHNP
jgi:phosphatidylglycerol:prolipoprotein diacylglycerol transferase